MRLGLQAVSLERAIDHFKQALTVYNREAFPEQWAMTQYNLANAYSTPIDGEGAENLEQAIDHFEQTLTISHPRGFSRAVGDDAEQLGLRV